MKVGLYGGVLIFDPANIKTNDIYSNLPFPCWHDRCAVLSAQPTRIVWHKAKSHAPASRGLVVEVAKQGSLVRAASKPFVAKVSLL